MNSMKVITNRSYTPLQSLVSIQICSTEIDVMEQARRELGLDEEVNLHFHKTDIIGEYVLLNKRAYHFAITAACALQNLEYANMLYDILVSNRIRPRKNTFYSIFDVVNVHNSNF